MAKYHTLQNDSVPSPVGSTSVLSTTQPLAPPVEENIGTPLPSYPPSQYGLHCYPNVTTKYGCLEDLVRNRPQARALAAGCLIFISGGMSLAWGIVAQPNFDEADLIHLKICWFLAVIIGACISGKFIEKIPKLSFDIIAALLVIANGILFHAFPSSVWSVAVARLCDGLANGLVVIPMIVVASERSVKRFRGFMMSLEQSVFTVGMTIFLIAWKSSVNHGIIAIIFAVATLVLTFIFPSESPISYLRKGDDQGALNALRQMQAYFIITPETYDLHNECKLLLEEDFARSRDLNMSRGVIPAITLCVFRGLVSLSSFLPLVGVFDLPDDDLTEISRYICASRLAGILIAQYVTLDMLGRKVVTGFSLLVGGGLLFAFIVMTSNSDSGNQKYIQIGNSARVLLIAYQVFVGMAAPASTCYLGEAFSISVKPFFTTAAIVFENIIQILILYVLPMNSVANYGYALGILQIIFAMFFLIRMPETKGTTLRQALAMFAKN